MGQRVGVTEAAKVVGVAKSTVSRQVIKFGLEKDAKGRFDLDEYRSRRDTELNPLMARNQDGVPETGPLPDEKLPAAAGGSDVLRFTQAATAEKATRAARQKLMLDKERGLLVERAEVEATAFDYGRRLRDGLLGVPRDIAEELSRLTEPREIRALLEQRLKTKFEEVIGELHGAADNAA